MSEMLDTLKKDKMETLRSKNVIARNILGTVIAECDTLSKNGEKMDDAKVLSIIQKTRKKLHETIQLISNMPDRAESKLQLLKEVSVLDAYMPAQLSKDEIEQIAIGQDSLNQSFGQIMSYFKKNYAGRYDPKETSSTIKEIIGFEGQNS
jgi:uncharacterized protein YqeY